MRWAAGQRLQRLSWTVSVLSVVVAASAGATEPAKVLQARDLPASAKTVQEWTAQVEAATAQITAIRLVPIAGRLQVQIDTADGRTLQATTREEGNTLIAEIANAVLALPEQSFRAEKPAFSAERNSVGTDITEVTATQVNAATVQIRIVGDVIAPLAEIVKSDQGLILSVEPDEDAAEEEITVTGEGARGYRVPNASTATRTDTPIRDIPQSIQVVPRQVLEDRNVQREIESLETISGMVQGGDNNAASPEASDVIIRGFSTRRAGNFRDGILSGTFTPIGVIEQVEVLKGPASVLFGALEPGGVINYVTRKPLAEPYYRIGIDVGNYGFYQPSIDLSGPLTEDKNVLYRLIAAYGGGGGFKDTSVSEFITSISPSISFKLGDRTTLNLFYEYGKSVGNVAYEPLLSDGSFIPKNVSPYYSLEVESENQRFGYTLNHEFNDNWQLRHGFSAAFSSFFYKAIEYGSLLEDRFLSDFFAFKVAEAEDKYFGLIDVVGKFKTGSISHQLVAGFDFNREVNYFGFSGDAVDLPRLDIFNPNYNVPLPEIPPALLTDLGISQSYGVYLQDQIAFSDNLKMLIGGRYDWISNETGPIDGDRTSQNDGAFSPRIGLVYQPSKNVSLYTSYVQSFRPASGRNQDNKPFEPTRGTQYEIGVKVDFLDGKLSTTLAAYNLTKTNVLTPDPDPDLARQGFQVQVGEQRSRGIELDVAGEILPGWNIIASYALTDTQVTEDNSIPSTVGNRFINVPQHQASLWSTYTIQEGDLQGLGFGLGLFYVGERQGDLANSFQVRDYLRTDAAIYYRRNGFNAAINVRNLFDIDYVSSANFGTLYINRGNPLTIVGSVSWEF
ncbi:TonB-dependent siderophore receptor [Myxacorys almedinensis A]|uniref:TonB-dependent siderophore receptor n=2 Tax=Myxacorys TaxID=2056239 RepID=A0A8J8CHN3_9CYAN|nr:TonB-dependent siderophore receptor [Myxacorys almedinensis A]